MAKKIKKTFTKTGVAVGEINGFEVRRFVVGDLTGADYNPRKISDAALSGLSRSVETFGVVQPIVWNEKTGNVVGGHQRLKTMSPEDVTDVVVVSLDLNDEKALNLSLNNPHTMGEFTSGLGEILKELEIALPDLSTELHLTDLYVDVPVEIDGLLDEEEEEEEPTPKKGSGKKSKEDEPKERPARSTITLTPDPDEYDDVVAMIEQVMEDEDLSSHTEAVVYLLRSYCEE